MAFLGSVCGTASHREGDTQKGNVKVMLKDSESCLKQDGTRCHFSAFLLYFCCVSILIFHKITYNCNLWVFPLTGVNRNSYETLSDFGDDRCMICILRIYYLYIKDY